MFVHYQSVYFAVERQHLRIKEMLQGKLDSRDGICSNLSHFNYSFDPNRETYSPYLDSIDTKEFMQQAFRTWNYFSGNIDYPVHDYDLPYPKDAYNCAQDEGTLWDRSTAYGAMRYDLLRHMERRYALFLSHCVRPQRSAMARFLKDDGFGQLIYAPDDTFVLIYAIIGRRHE